jgi:uncharacterized membrane protein
MVLATGFAVTALSHFLSGRIAAGCEELALTNPWIKDFNLTSTFFWLVVLATTGGVMLSFTRLKNLEGVGASRIATVFLYLLVVTIGLKMDVFAIFNNPGVFVIGGIWMLIHILLLVGVTILIRAPVFFMAVGSKANIGGAVSAPIVAAAFHPSLAPVGVLLAVLGYALGTYAAWLCGLMMQAVAPPG